MARPQKEIDKVQFEKLCAIQCTELEICSFFGVSDKTLDKWCKRTYGCRFSVIFGEKREAGKVSLRRSQWQQAQTNPTMAIWLGKQFLNQRDNKDIVVKQTIEPETVEAVEAFINGINTEPSEDD